MSAQEMEYSLPNTLSDSAEAFSVQITLNSDQALPDSLNINGLPSTHASSQADVIFTDSSLPIPSEPQALSTGEHSSSSPIEIVDTTSHNNAVQPTSEGKSKGRKRERRNQEYETDPIMLIRHSKQRSAQRNLSPGDIGYIFENGTHIRTAGADFYFLGLRDIPKEDLGNDDIRRLEGAVLVTDEYGTVVTCYRNKRGWKDIRLKSAEIRKEAVEIEGEVDGIENVDVKELSEI